MRWYDWQCQWMEHRLKASGTATRQINLSHKLFSIIIQQPLSHYCGANATHIIDSIIQRIDRAKHELNEIEMQMDVFVIARDEMSDWITFARWPDAMAKQTIEQKRDNPKYQSWFEIRIDSLNAAIIFSIFTFLVWWTWSTYGTGWVMTNPSIPFRDLLSVCNVQMRPQSIQIDQLDLHSH